MNGTQNPRDVYQEVREQRDIKQLELLQDFVMYLDANGYFNDSHIGHDLVNGYYSTKSKNRQQEPKFFCCCDIDCQCNACKEREVADKKAIL